MIKTIIKAVVSLFAKNKNEQKKVKQKTHQEYAYKPVTRVAMISPSLASYRSTDRNTEGLRRVKDNMTVSWSEYIENARMVERIFATKNNSRVVV